MPACTACKKGPPEVSLKYCAKCSTTPYCSRDCQKDDWKTHKKICGKQDPPPRRSSAPPTSSALDAAVSDPFTRLDNGTWLYDRPEKDVFHLLIDAYRMRMEDNYKIDGKCDEDSIYGGSRDGVAGFQRFLDKVASKRGLLPAWWNEEKKAECVRYGQGEDPWARLDSAVEKADVSDHYNDGRFPMQLRMFGEAVYGIGPGGSNGTAMRKMLASMEGGGDGPFGGRPGVMSHFDVSGGRRR
ncbi:putative MYND domain protein [Lasiosphaeria ovina]|uniref:MYND domain protein n=1 Tax=Lasiosphaeria ovina TaxID=92902 RepID=A0AAE0MYR1_9PEZI|nr:putative MYND domain protein [Lasiosphaeria ovina]